jgi:hypothetical protein
MSRTRTLSRSAAIRLWMERAAPVAAVCLLMLGGGLMMTRPPESGLRSCVARYGQARTAADTMEVDRRWADGAGMLGVRTGGDHKLRRGARTTCGWARRNGRLDLYRAPEAER